MNISPLRYGLLFLCLCICAGCANIVPPSGGPKDITPPKLVSVTPADSLTGVRTTGITMNFDEFITLSDPGTQVQISPLLPVPLTVTALNRRVTIQIPDTLLLENTTYRITFGNAIRDLREGNIYNAPGYIFSTGAYFDSLRLSGRVLNAVTGLPDSTASVLLYDAAGGDSAVVRRRPLYTTHVDAAGFFALDGLPSRKFLMYALRDANSNLIFDGGTEWIAFLDEPVTPSPDSGQLIGLRLFQEAAGSDTALAAGRSNSGKTDVRGRPPGSEGNAGNTYQVLVDTTDTRRRSQDITLPLAISFARLPAVINPGKVYLSFDSAGITVEAGMRVRVDTPKLQLEVETPWKEGALYTLRLQKGFARDSAGTDYLPGRYTFRTRREEDYAKLGIHLPARFYRKGYVLQVTNETDTIWQRPVTDTLISLARIPAGTYSMRVIEDRNGNGRWDPGDLLARRQPELVIPYSQPLRLKAGWEDRIDFEQVQQPKGKNAPAAPPPPR